MKLKQFTDRMRDDALRFSVYYENLRKKFPSMAVEQPHVQWWKAFGAWLRVDAARGRRRRERERSGGSDGGGDGDPRP